MELEREHNNYSKLSNDTAKDGKSAAYESDLSENQASFSRWARNTIDWLKKQISSETKEEDKLLKTELKLAEINALSLANQEELDRLSCREATLLKDGRKEQSDLRKLLIAEEINEVRKDIAAERGARIRLNQERRIIKEHLENLVTVRTAQELPSVLETEDIRNKKRLRDEELRFRSEDLNEVTAAGQELDVDPGVDKILKELNSAQTDLSQEMFPEQARKISKNAAPSEPNIRTMDRTQIEDHGSV